MSPILGEIVHQEIQAMYRVRLGAVEICSRIQRGTGIGVKQEDWGVVVGGL